MLIQCKTAGCPGHVDYTPQVVPLSLFVKAFEGDEKFMIEPINSEKFQQAVSNIVKAKTNYFNTTKTVYLTCDNVASSHTNAYQVPSK